MHTYIKTNDSTEFAAIRASRAEVLRVRPDLKDRIVPATKKLRRDAYMSWIPTYFINERVAGNLMQA